MSKIRPEDASHAPPDRGDEPQYRSKRAREGRRHGARNRSAFVASSPGIEHAAGVAEPPTDESIQLECIDYGKTVFERHRFGSVDALLEHPRAAGAEIRWINVEGLHPYVINQLRKAYGFHTLAAEDAFHTGQRPKLEQYQTHSLLILDMIQSQQETLLSEQVSFFVTPELLITFQEKPGDVWNPIRERIQRPNARFRRYGIWYLVYSLVDAVIDNLYPIIEHYADTVAELEDHAMRDPKPAIQQRAYLIKRDLYRLQRSLWPLRELANKLASDDNSPVDKKVRIYMRDVQDHVAQILDLLESSREMASSLQDFYNSVAANRMTEAMKALTIMASLFLPLTFLAGVYGMNFEILPELRWPYAYPAFWAVCILSTAGLLWYFKRRGWLGN